MIRRILLVPAACAALALPAAAQQTPTEQPPAPGPLRPFTVPPVRELRLANGVRVVVVEKHSLPIVAGRILVGAGSGREPTEKNGLASLTAQLLDEGTSSLTGTQIAERMEALGAQLGTGAGYSHAVVSVTAPKSTFGEAMALAASTLIEPSFAEGEMTRVRNQMAAAYTRSQSTVEGLAGIAFNRALWESHSEYSRPVGGTTESLQRISREDVAAFHKQRYFPAGTTVLLVGDLTQDEARRIAEQSLGRWAAEPTYGVSRDSGPVQVSGNRIILVDRPGSVQSGVYAGQAGVGAQSPDMIALSALTQVLGGGFRARLNTNLREAHGWTYGAFAGMNTYPGAGDFFVSTSVRTNATDSAVAEIVREYRRIATEPVPAAELRGSLANVTGSFPNSVQTVQGLAGRMQTLLQNGQPLDYYNTYLERVSAVTPADITRVAGSVLTPNAITVVVAGDLSKIEAPIRALNLGQVEVVDASGARVR